MKKFKRITAFVIALIMMASLCAVEAYGQNEPASAKTLLSSCKSVAKTMGNNKLSYARGWYKGASHNKHRYWQLARKKEVICSDFVSYALQDAGYITKKQNFLISHKGNVIVFKYNSKGYCKGWKKAGTKLNDKLKNEFKFVTRYKGKKIKSIKSKLKPGDIVASSSEKLSKASFGNVHIMIYAGKKNGKYYWWNGGSMTLDKHGYAHPKKQANIYDDNYVTVVLRPRAK